MAAPNSAKSKWADVATVTLIVGESKTAFHVHEATLFEASPFFKAAFTLDFRESSERVMTLPGEDESIFGLFVDWLYHQRYDILLNPNKSENKCDRYMQPVQLFALADRYDVRSLRNLLVSQMFALLKQENLQSLEIQTFVYAYEHTSPNSSIRKLLADYLAWVVDKSSFKPAIFQAWLQGYPDISVDLNVSFVKHMGKRSPFAGKMPEDYIEKE